MTASGPVVDALTALQAAGLVTDRDHLNAAWSQLTGRTDPPQPAACQRPSCPSPAVTWVEPAGTWCLTHLPQPWRTPNGSPWACPRCHECGQPARYPRRRGPATCREHAPRSIRRYLAPCDPRSTS